MTLKALNRSSGRKVHDAKGAKASQLKKKMIRDTRRRSSAQLATPIYTERLYVQYSKTSIYETDKQKKNSKVPEFIQNRLDNYLKHKSSTSDNISIPRRRNTLSGPPMSASGHMEGRLLKTTTADEARRRSSLRIREDIDRRRRSEADLLKAHKWNFIEVKPMDEDVMKQIVQVNKNAAESIRRNSALVEMKRNRDKAIKEARRQSVSQGYPFRHEETQEEKEQDEKDARYTRPSPLEHLGEYEYENEINESTPRTEKSLSEKSRQESERSIYQEEDLKKSNTDQVIEEVELEKSTVSDLRNLGVEDNRDNFEMESVEPSNDTVKFQKQINEVKRADINKEVPETFQNTKNSSIALQPSPNSNASGRRSSRVWVEQAPIDTEWDFSTLGNNRIVMQINNPKPKEYPRFNAKTKDKEIRNTKDKSQSVQQSKSHKKYDAERKKFEKFLEQQGLSKPGSGSPEKQTFDNINNISKEERQAREIASTVKGIRRGSHGNLHIGIMLSPTGITH